ncbi:lysine decarboxylase-like protein [Niveomyces insectorum RCEF 264]|uniref:Lysine decarboxylase-like protein n=1 Tax=Niveomyces insectorum RCEF 264 TaxID=1081102 RepID=A0A168AI23_9HYPO|nr:lysine decarboxylase-like protein [Niveomyces insectorum RCEF 264]
MESGGASPMPSASASRTATSTPTLSSLGPNAASSTPKKTKICVYCGSSTGKNPIYMETARELARVMAENNIGLVYGGGTVGLMGELARTLVSLAGPDAVHGIIPEALVRYERDPHYTSWGKTQADKKVEAHAEGKAAPTNGSSSSSDTGPADAAAAATNGTTVQKSGPHDEATPCGLAVPAESVFGKTTVVRDMHTRKRIMAQEVLEAGPGSGFIALSGGYGTFEELLETSTWNQLGIHNKGVCVLNVNGFYDGLFSWIRTSVQEGFIFEGNAGIIAEATTPADAVRALREYQVAPSVLKLAWGKE